MGTAFSLPDLGEGLHEAEIVAWHVGAGDRVVADQPLVTVETDKAMVEVPSPRAGRIESLCAEPGDIVTVGQPLVEFAAGEAEDSGAIVGRLPTTAAGPQPGQAAPGEGPQPGQAAPSAEPQSGQAAPPSAGPGQAAPAAEEKGLPSISASPAVRRLARSFGVDLADVEGTGIDGSITRTDVEAAAGAEPVVPPEQPEQPVRRDERPASIRPPGPEAAGRDAPVAPPEPQAAGPGATPEHRGAAPGAPAAQQGAAPGEPIRGVRRAMLKNMARAGREVVHATITDEADIERWSDATDVTVRLIRAIVAGCRESPALNAWFDPVAETRTVHSRIDLGVAVETDQGLFAPVISDVGNRDADDLRRGLDALKRDVEARSVPRSSLSGQTITLSNFGMFGGRFADLVVMPPQVAILGAGRAEPRPVAVDGQVAVHRLLPLSLSFDHRVVTGVEAARFLGAVVADLEQGD